MCSCASGANDTSYPESGFRVGILWRSSGIQSQNIARIVEAAGGELVTLDFESKGMINRVQELIDANVDGILIMPTDEAALPQITEMCEEAGVFWAINNRPIHNQEIKQIVESSPYYTGHVQESDEETAYEIVKLLALEGSKSIALIMPFVTDSVGDARARGVNRAVAEFDIEIVAEINTASTDEDFFKAVSNIIIAYPKLDTVFRVGALNTNSSRCIIDAIEASDRFGQIKFASIDIDGLTEEDFEKGVVIVAAGGHKEFDCVLAAGILVNALNGTPISEDGPAEVTVEYLMFHTAQDLRKYNQAFNDNGGILFSEEAARQMLLRKYNDKITQTDYEKIVNTYTLDNLDILKTWNPD